jgi:hypothetical protein
MPTEFYKNAEAYRKARAYTHIHHIPTHAMFVVVAGKKHRVQHDKKKSDTGPSIEVKKGAKKAERKR